MCFINFGRPGKVFKDYTSFAIVIFAEGLYKLQKLKGFSLDDLKSLAGKHIEITGLLGIYPNVNKDCLVPEIILDNPYTLRIIDENERQVLPTGTPISTTSVMLPTAESKPVPPSVRTTNTINRTSTPTSTNLPSKPKPPTPNVPTTNIPSVPVNSSVNNPPPSVNSSTPNTPPPPSPPEDTGNGAGTITGIFIGAAIGGPVGAVVGGVAGALVGNWLRSLGKK